MLPNCCCEPDCTPQNELCISWGRDWLAEPNSFFGQCPIGPTTVDFSLIDIVGFDEDEVLQFTYPCEFLPNITCNTVVTPQEFHPNIIQTDPIIPFTKLITNNAYYAEIITGISFDFYSYVLVDGQCTLANKYITNSGDIPSNSFGLNCVHRANESELIYNLHKAKYQGTTDPSVIDLDDRNFYGQWNCGQSCIDYHWNDTQDATWNASDTRSLNYHINHGITGITSTDITACRNRLRPWYTNWTYYDGSFNEFACSCVSGGIYTDVGKLFNKRLNENIHSQAYGGQSCHACNTLAGGTCDNVNGWVNNDIAPCGQESSDADCDDSKSIGNQTWDDISNPDLNYIFEIEDLLIPGDNEFIPNGIFDAGNIIIAHAFFFEPTSTKCYIRQEFSLDDQSNPTSSVVSMRGAALSFGIPMTTETAYGNIWESHAIFLYVKSNWFSGFNAGSDASHSHDIYCGVGAQMATIPITHFETISDSDDPINVTSLGIEIERFINYTLNNKIKKVKFFVNDNMVFEYVYPSNKGMKLCNSTPIESAAAIITKDSFGFNNSMNFDENNFALCFDEFCGNPLAGIDCNQYTDVTYAVSPHEYTISAPTLTWS